MINSDKKENERLPEFQKYLIDKKLVAESKTSYFAYWVSRYLAYARRQKAPVDDYQEQVVAAFLDEMRSDSRIVYSGHRACLKTHYLSLFGLTGQSRSH